MIRRFCVSRYNFTAPKIYTRSRSVCDESRGVDSAYAARFSQRHLPSDAYPALPASGAAQNSPTSDAIDSAPSRAAFRSRCSQTASGASKCSRGSRRPTPPQRPHNALRASSADDQHSRARSTSASTAGNRIDPTSTNACCRAAPPSPPRDLMKHLPGSTPGKTFNRRACSIASDLHLAERQRRCRDPGFNNRGPSVHRPVCATRQRVRSTPVAAPSTRVLRDAVGAPLASDRASSSRSSNEMTRPRAPRNRDLRAGRVVGAQRARTGRDRHRCHRAWSRRCATARRETTHDGVDHRHIGAVIDRPARAASERRGRRRPTRRSRGTERRPSFG